MAETTNELPSSDLSIEEEIDEQIRKLDVSIDELTRKIEQGRVRDCEKERVRIKRHRALVQALKARGDMVEQRELQQLHERVQRIENKRGGGR